MKKLIFIFILLLGMTGCQKTDSMVYQPPAGFVFDETSQVLSWEASKEASGYVVSINDKLHNVTGISMDVSNLEAGVYEVKIKAVYEGGTSRFTVPFTIQIVKPVLVDVNLLEDTITFDSITQGISYRVESYDFLGNKTTEVTLDHNQLKPTSDMGFSHYKVTGTLNQLEVYTKDIYVDVVGYTYFQESDCLIVPVQSVEKVFLDDVLLETEHYLFSNGQLSICKDYLSGLEAKNYVLKIEGEALYLLNVIVSNTKQPRLISENNILFNHEDVSFTFQLYDGAFAGISSDPMMSDSDYTFNESTLTISKGFIEQLILDDVTRKQVIFQYELTNNEVTVIGYLTIRLTE
ncbi:MAG: hypothetical protein RBQ91_05155 [Acholeplasma sp.]|nr:hypothetical protein [Acholeplasma sp.]